MDNVATASLNNLRVSEAEVPPSEDPIFVLTSSQLRQIITEAVHEAIQPLQDRIEGLESTVASQGEETVFMRSTVASLESLLESEISRVCVDIAHDRRRLAALEKVEPQPLQKDRGEILRALIAANGGKMLAKDARAKMRMDKGNFSRLLDILKDDIETKPLHQDKRNLVLIIK